MKENRFTAQILIENELGEFLCVSRKNNHKHFGLPGGKSEFNESPIETAIRETQEETGIDLNNLKSNLKLILSADCKGFFSYTYYIKMEKSKCVINHNEPHIVKWGDKNDLINGPFGTYNKMLFHNL